MDNGERPFTELTKWCKIKREELKDDIIGINTCVGNDFSECLK